MVLYLIGKLPIICLIAVGVSTIIFKLIDLSVEFSEWIRKINLLVYSDQPIATTCYVDDKISKFGKKEKTDGYFYLKNNLDKVDFSVRAQNSHDEVLIQYVRLNEKGEPISGDSLSNWTPRKSLHFYPTKEELTEMYEEFCKTKSSRKDKRWRIK